MFARKKLSFFLPQDTKFTLKEETENSLLFHNQNPNPKIVALKIENSLFLSCHKIELCFKNKENFTQFKQCCPILKVRPSRDHHNLILDALNLSQHQDVNLMETSCFAIYNGDKPFSRHEGLAKLLFYMNAFDPMNMSMIKKIDEKFFNFLYKNRLLESIIQNQLISAHYKGTMIGFFQKIGLTANIDTLLTNDYINEEDGKNLALVAKDIALTGAKMHNEEAERISLRR